MLKEHVFGSFSEKISKDLSIKVKNSLAYELWISLIRLDSISFFLYNVHFKWIAHSICIVLCMQKSIHAFYCRIESLFSYIFFPFPVHKTLTYSFLRENSEKNNNNNNSQPSKVSLKFRSIKSFPSLKWKFILNFLRWYCNAFAGNEQLHFRNQNFFTFFVLLLNIQTLKTRFSLHWAENI